MPKTQIANHEIILTYLFICNYGFRKEKKFWFFYDILCH